ncbi:MAG: hypothetical protein Q9219_004439 [cf. Caloplaca sp. 3 TL-2023]
MAEAIAAVGLAASIIQLVDLGTKFTGRLEEYKTKSTEIPAVFGDIALQLQLLIPDLRKTKERAEKSALSSDAADAVSNVVRSCGDHIKTLDEILVKTMPTSTDSAWQTGKKVLLSIRQEEKVQHVAKKLQEHVIYLTHHTVVNPSQGPGDSPSATVQNDEHCGIFQWLSNDDPSTGYNRAIQKKQRGSGQWFLDSANIPLAVQEMCAKYRASGHQPTTTALLATLHSAIDSIRKKTFLVLDALDEYPESRRHELHAALKLLKNSEHGDVHVLVTSRREYDIEHALKNIATHEVSIQGPMVDDDIRSYVKAKLAEDDRLSRLPSAIRDSIEVQLVTKAHGMSVLQAQVIQYASKSLDQLPVTLDDTYERILRAIEPADTSEAYHILQWVAFAERPLTLEELAEAAVTSEDGGPIDPEERLFDPYDVVRICKSLISLADDTLYICNKPTSAKVVRFAHFSVKEYLLSSRILDGKTKRYHLDAQKSQQQIGQSCLSVLLQNDKIGEDQNLPLIKYAAENWVQHFRRSETYTEDLSALKNSVERLFVYSPDAFRNWALVSNGDHGRINDAGNPGPDLSWLPSPLYYASWLGLGDAVLSLLKSGVDVNEFGGALNTALIAAISAGHLAIAQVLLNHNANVNADGPGLCITALQLASHCGYQSMVEMLLDAGAEPDLKQETIQIDASALQLACKAGHLSIAETLIDRGSDGHALTVAAEEGHYDVVCLLLRRGASVNNGGGIHSTALQAAAKAGFESIMRLLLDQGADVNVLGGFPGDALRASVSSGNQACVKLLLEHGASIEHLTSRLLESRTEFPEIRAAISTLASQLQSAYDTRDSLSDFVALIKRVDSCISLYAEILRVKQSEPGIWPNLPGREEGIRRAVKREADQWPSDA